MFRVMRAVKIAVMIVVFSLVAGFVVKLLWNWLMPPIFGLTMINFWQAVGLLLLSKLLLGGFHRHGPRGGRRRWKHREWKRRMEAKWERMSPEDRERFRAGMKGRCGWGPRGFEAHAEFNPRKDEGVR